MKFKSISFSVLLSLSIMSLVLSSYAAVVVLAEVPEAMKQLLVKAQIAVQERLAQINDQSKDEQYIFQQSSYSPHVTLAYITHQAFSMSDLEKEEPQLIENLAQLTKRPAINMRDGMQESQFVVWQGKGQSPYEGNTYKNYAILVIKMEASEQLIRLVEDLDKTLEKHPTALKRSLPFSPHVTIGWVYDKKDVDPTPMVEAVQSELKRLVAEFETDQSFTIDSFKLSTHDKKQLVFPFIP